MTHRPLLFLALIPAILAVQPLPAAHPNAAPGVTSLTVKNTRYTVPATHHVQLKRGPVTIIITDNEAVDIPELPGHRAGFNGIASLKHEKTGANLFVPTYAGLNVEDIHDGTSKVNKDIFDPRTSPMQLRVVDEFTVELYQPPTLLWQLESCGRFHLLPDGAIEYTFECIPRAGSFQPGWFSLFWASYIETPEDNGIHFVGRNTKAPKNEPAAWIHALSPWHGVDSSVPPAGALPELKFSADFPLQLVTSRSPYVHTEPWFYGVSHGLAFVKMFRERDRIWFSQSPSGGGAINPAWDFHWFVHNWKPGEAYGFVMRTACFPWQNEGQIKDFTAVHRNALNKIQPAKSKAVE